MEDGRGRPSLPRSRRGGCPHPPKSRSDRCPNLSESRRDSRHWLPGERSSPHCLFTAAIQSFVPRPQESIEFPDFDTTAHAHHQETLARVHPRGNRIFHCAADCPPTLSPETRASALQVAG